MNTRPMISWTEFVSFIALFMLGPVEIATVVAQCIPEENCVAIHRFDGEAAGDQFGWAIENAGDIDGDNTDDVISGAPFNDANGASAGRAYVHSGASDRGNLIHTFTGDAAGDQLGFHVSSAGDVDGDNVDDVIVGADQNGTGNGYARVFSGVDGSTWLTLTGEGTGGRFGFAVNGAGDVNSDGHDDVVVGEIGYDGAVNNIGRAYLFSGMDGTKICSADGPLQGDNLGSSIAGVGDVNGDDVPDFMASAQNAGPTNGGLAFVYSGVDCSLIHTLTPGGASSNMGQFFADGPGDVNKDGTPDIYAGDFAAGTANVFSGLDGSVLYTLTENDVGSQQFGIGRGAGDVDNDGFKDLILGDWIFGGVANQAGRVSIYSGRDASILQRMTHPAAGNQFGFDSSGMGDVDSDGLFDYVISMPPFNGKGRVIIIAGQVARRIRGDLDQNGVVNLADFATFATCFGLVAPTASCGADELLDSDLDDDKLVNLVDFATFAVNFGS